MLAQVKPTLRFFKFDAYWDRGDICHISIRTSTITDSRIGRMKNTQWLWNIKNTDEINFTDQRSSGRTPCLLIKVARWQRWRDRSASRLRRKINTALLHYHLKEIKTQQLRGFTWDLETLVTVRRSCTQASHWPARVGPLLDGSFATTGVNFT